LVEREVCVLPRCEGPAIDGSLGGAQVPPAVGLHALSGGQEARLKEGEVLRGEVQGDQQAPGAHLVAGAQVDI
jgi:hypothetical protein